MCSSDGGVLMEILPVESALAEHTGVLKFLRHLVGSIVTFMFFALSGDAEEISYSFFIRFRCRYLLVWDWVVLSLLERNF